MSLLVSGSFSFSFSVSRPVLMRLFPCSKTVSAATLKQAWASVVIQRHWRGYRTRQIYQVVLLASITIQAFTRGWMARKRYKKVGGCIGERFGVMRNKTYSQAAHFFPHPHISDGGGAKSPGPAEVCPSVAGAAALSNHAPAGAQCSAVLQGAAAQEEDRGAGKDASLSISARA